MIARALLKKFFRDVKRNKLLFLALIVLNILGVASYVSFIQGYQSLDNSYNQFYEDYSFHDIEIQTSKGSWINQTALENCSKAFTAQHSEIQNVNYRVIVESGYNLSIKEEFLYGEGKVIGFDTNLSMGQRINRLYIESGTTFLPGESYSNKVIIDTKFADRMNLTVGNKLSIGLSNFKKFEIIGIAHSVEYIIVIPSRYGSIFPRTRYGIFFMPISEVQEVWELNGKVNNIIMTFNEDEPIKTKIELAKNFSNMIESNLDVNLLNPVSQELQISNWFLRINVEGFKDLSEFLPLLILGTATLAVFITLNRLIDSQKRHIGIALSLGYDPKDLLLYYLGFIFVIASIGGTLGVLLGVILSNVIAEVYVSAVTLPLTNIDLNPSILLVGFLSGFVVVFGGFLPAWRGSHMTPKETMEGYTRILPIRENFIWRFISNLSIKAPLRLTFRNIFRNRWRSSTNLLGLVASVTILVISLTLLDSTMTTLNSEFNIVLDYDLELTYNNPKLGDLGLYNDTRIIKRIASKYGIESWDCALEIPVTFSSLEANKKNEGLIIAYNSTIPSTHKFIWDRSFSSNWENPNSSIVLTSGLANFFNLQFQSGTEIRITHPRLPISSLEELWLRAFFQQHGKNSTLDLLKNQLYHEAKTFNYNQSENYSLENSTLNIGGISKETWGTLSYMSLNKMAELLGFGIFYDMGIDLTPVSKIFIKLSSEGKKVQSELKEEILSQLDNVQSVISKDEVVEGIMEFLGLLFALIGVMIGFSSLISISIVFTTVFLNIHERKRELGTMQVMGMTNREIALNILTIENLVIGISALIIGFPIGLIITRFIIDVIFPKMVYFEVSIQLTTFLMIILLSISSILLAEYPAFKQLFNLELVSMTKEFID
ncbi:MAG: ABC transporter permease [Promethearchaeota archaeon]